MAIYSDFTIDQGSNFTTTVNVTGPDGAPLNLELFTVRGKLRKSWTSPNAMSFDAVVEDAAEGKITLTLLSVQTLALRSGRYVYDAEIVSSTGDVIRIIEGQITITPSVTQGGDIIDSLDTDISILGTETQYGLVKLGAPGGAATFEAATEGLDAHIADLDNPHAVTKSQVGLPNVDNTSDAAKPISTATATALSQKQPLSSVLTNTTASFTTAQETKLSGIAAGATVNSSDAILLDRANHTGTQAQSTIVGLEDDLSSKISDAPSDDIQYARKNASWVEVNGVPNPEYYSENWVSAIGDGPAGVNTTNGPITATAPAAPQVGDPALRFFDAFSTYSSNSFTFARNGNLIEGIAEDLICDTDGVDFEAIFVGGSIGWHITRLDPEYTTGPQGETGPTGPQGPQGLNGFVFDPLRVTGQKGQYTVGEIVFYSGSYWICIANNDAIIPSPSSSSYWSPYSFISSVNPYDAGNITGTVTFNLTNGTLQKASMTGNCTVAVPTGAVSGFGSRLELWLTPSGIDRTLNFNSSIKIPSDSALSLPKTLTVSKQYIILLKYNGTSWLLASIIGGY